MSALVAGLHVAAENGRPAILDRIPCATERHPLPMRAFAVCTFLVGALPAEGHLNSTGRGPFYDGSMHFLTSSEDIVPVLALAMLAGLRGVAFGRRALFVLPAAWLFGGFLGLTTVATRGNAMLTAASFLLLGALLAADAKLSLRVTTALAAVLGVYHGYLNGTGMGRPGIRPLAAYESVAVGGGRRLPSKGCWATFKRSNRNSSFRGLSFVQEL